MRIPVNIRTRYYEADNQKALVDSGATDCFIHPRFAKRMKVGRQALDKPKKIFNIDNTENKSGSITHFVDLKVQTKGVVKDIRFLVADIGTKNILLGYPWLAAFKPGFKWKTAIMDSANFPVIISSSIPSPDKTVITKISTEQKDRIVNQLQDQCTIKGIATELAISDVSAQLAGKMAQKQLHANFHQ